MKHETKKTIRKHIRSLGLNETIQEIEHLSEAIKEYASKKYVPNLDGAKKHIKKNIDIEIAAYKMECAAKHLQRMADIEQHKWALPIVDGIFDPGT